MVLCTLVISIKKGWPIGCSMQYYFRYSIRRVARSGLARYNMDRRWLLQCVAYGRFGLRACPSQAVQNQSQTQGPDKWSAILLIGYHKPEQGLQFLHIHRSPVRTITDGASLCLCNNQIETQSGNLNAHMNFTITEDNEPEKLITRIVKIYKTTSASVESGSE